MEYQENVVKNTSQYREDFIKIEEKLLSKDWLVNHPKIKNQEILHKFEDLRIEMLVILNNYKDKYLDLMSTNHWYWKSDLYNYFRFSIMSKAQNEDNKLFWSKFIRNVIVNWLVYDFVREERNYNQANFNK